MTAGTAHLKADGLPRKALDAAAVERCLERGMSTYRCGECGATHAAPAARRSRRPSPPTAASRAREKVFQGRGGFGGGCLNCHCSKGSHAEVVREGRPQMIGPCRNFGCQAGGRCDGYVPERDDS